MNSIDDVVTEIVLWQRETFKQATTHSRKTHLIKELKELKKELKRGNIDWHEVADVLFMIIALADGEDMNLVDVLSEKLEINRARVWGEPDKDGVVEHVRDNRHFSYAATKIIEMPKFTEQELEEIRQLNRRVETLIESWDNTKKFYSNPNDRTELEALPASKLRMMLDDELPG